MIFLVISYNCVWVYIPGDAGQVSNYIEEIFLWHFTKAWVLWESDDGGTVFPSPSYSTKKPNKSITAITVLQDILSFNNSKGIWNADICKTSITAIWNCVSFKKSEMKVKTPFNSEYMKLFCFPSRNCITGIQMRLGTWWMGNDLWECGSTKCKMVYQRNTPILTHQYCLFL